MREIDRLFLKRRCIEFAVNNNLTIKPSSTFMFIAEDSESIIQIDYLSLFELMNNGWSVEDILRNETNYKEAV